MARAHGIMPQSADGVVRRMKAVFLSCLDVLLLRAGPQVFPRSRLFLALMLLAYLLTDALLNCLEGYSALPMLVEAVFDTGIWVLCFVLALAGWSVLPRLEQTLTAWFGAGILFNLIQLPMELALYLLPNLDIRDWLPVPVFMLCLWTMMVMANLLRHALRANYVVAVVIAVISVLANIILTSSLFPVA